MCKVLELPRSTYYFILNMIESEDKDKELRAEIEEIFIRSRNNYGTRKIKVELKKKNFIVSRRRIGRIMKEQGLISNYTVSQYKVHKTKCNEDKIANALDREFTQKMPLNVVTSDLTYVRVGAKWNYICFILDLFNREVIGYSVGDKKDAELVKLSFMKTNYNLGEINLFHTDRGNEFKNKIIDELLEVFSIKRSLSLKGCPYDNAVSESTFKILKLEFVNNHKFETIEELELLLSDYVNWYNNIRIHGSLNYMTPKEYREKYSS